MSEKRGEGGKGGGTTGLHPVHSGFGQESVGEVAGAEAPPDGATAPVILQGLKEGGEGERGGGEGGGEEGGRIRGGGEREGEREGERKGGGGVKEEPERGTGRNMEGYMCSRGCIRGGGRVGRVSEEGRREGGRQGRGVYRRGGL